VVQLDAGQQNFTQSDSLTVIGSSCEAAPTVTAATSLPAYAVALIVIGAIIVGIVILLIIAAVIFVVFRFCNKDEKPKTFKDEEMKNVESGENNNNNNNYEAVEEVSEKPEEPAPEVKYSQVNKQPEQDKLVYADLQFAEQSVSQNPPPQKDVVVYSEITKNQDDVRVVEGTGDDTVADDN
jgi:FtsZ-interacting cell division protein ZipA